MSFGEAEFVHEALDSLDVGVNNSEPHSCVESNGKDMSKSIFVSSFIVEKELPVEVVVVVVGGNSV